MGPAQDVAREYAVENRQRNRNEETRRERVEQSVEHAVEPGYCGVALQSRGTLGTAHRDEEPDQAIEGSVEPA